MGVLPRSACSADIRRLRKGGECVTLGMGVLDRQQEWRILVGHMPSAKFDSGRMKPTSYPLSLCSELWISS
ncbi:hypothetical protein PSJM300_15175 [Stutzerimonas stutzeri DSM 10701]|nr:hypothetical protein PSJM300_15175 [Stutzerimonas stutzeri DSM 10701]HAQ74554.1 hypothetical protein [Pseudomonas sp.]